jgi:hypothetical protein
VQYVKKNSKQQMSFNLFAVTNVKKKHYQDSIEELMSAYHVNKGDTMATIKQAVEDALLELLDEGKIVIKGPDGEEMEDLTIEMKVVEDDNLYESEDSSSDDEDLEDEDDK